MTSTAVSRFTLAACLGLSLAVATPAFADTADGVLLEETRQTYVFETKALGRASRAMLRAAPDGADGKPTAGHVESRWSLRLRPVATPSSCAVDDVTITVSSTVTAPEWSNIDRLPDEAQREWQRYSAALRTYQDGHIAITANMAHKIREALLALPPSPNCEALQTAAGEASAAVEAEFADAHADYDRATRWGKELGAVLRKQYTGR